jgi:hypothetical protein
MTRGGLALITVLWLAGCGAATPYRTAPLVFDAPLPATLAHDADDLRIAQVVAHLIHGRLGLPFPEQTTVRVYVNQATFADGLARDGGQLSHDAWDRARVFAAVTSPRGLFVRGDLINSMRFVDKVGVIAHELAHISQIEMRRGGRGAPAQWVREGHADWVKFQVLEYLAIRSYADSRVEVQRAVLRSTTPIRFFPSLDDLSRNDRWTDANMRLGWAATYGQAFLAVDWLVERYGIESLHAFSRRFALEADPRSHWRVVFPIEFAEFVSQFRARLERLGG